MFDKIDRVLVSRRKNGGMMIRQRNGTELLMSDASVNYYIELKGRSLSFSPQAFGSRSG
jgi:hypothetical protein